MIPGFFKRGWYARQVRRVLSEMDVVSLLTVDVTPYTFVVTSSVVLQFEKRFGTMPSAIEVEAFGVLEVVTSSGAHWDVEFRDPDTALMTRLSVGTDNGARDNLDLPWYARGRTTNVQPGEDYKFTATEMSGAGTLRVFGVRLYGVW